MGRYSHCYHLNLRATFSPGMGVARASSHRHRIAVTGRIAGAVEPGFTRDALCNAVQRPAVWTKTEAPRSICCFSCPKPEKYCQPIILISRSALAAGREILNVVPFPGSDATSRAPLCWRIISRAMDRPSPVPLPRGLVEKNGSKI